MLPDADERAVKRLAYVLANLSDSKHKSVARVVIYSKSNYRPRTSSRSRISNFSKVAELDASDLESIRDIVKSAIYEVSAEDKLSGAGGSIDELAESPMEELGGSPMEELGGSPMEELGGSPVEELAESTAEQEAEEESGTEAESLEDLFNDQSAGAEAAATAEEKVASSIRGFKKKASRGVKKLGSVRKSGSSIEDDILVKMWMED
jgi:hypothetical protein